MSSLSTHLLNLDPPALQRATQHPFLQAAASSTLPPAKVKHWLAQDRLYALSYVNFIGSLLAKVSLPTGVDREETIEWRVTDTLIECLINIRQEIKLFEETASEEGWLKGICDCTCERPTRSYRDLFAGAGASGRSLLLGLVVLWATEECYFRAWKYAAAAVMTKEGDESGDVMQRVFIPNWSSVAFEGFVKGLEELVNEMGAEEGVEEGGRVWRECEEAFRQVIWVEEEFWPKI